MAALLPLDLPTTRNLLSGQSARISPAVELPGVFTPDECARIIALRDTLGFDQAPIPKRSDITGEQRVHAVDTSVRRTERTHILDTPAHRWIFDKVGAAVQEANDATWQFRIAFMEPMQLLAYPQGGHFEWHSDLGDRGIASLRKVSATILLSDPDSYEGGDLQLLDGGKELTPGRNQGMAVFFPSFQNHRVLPVTRGTRHVLILWTVGKRPFR